MILGTYRRDGHYRKVYSNHHTYNAVCVFDDKYCPNITTDSVKPSDLDSWTEIPGSEFHEVFERVNELIVERARRVLFKENAA